MAFTLDQIVPWGRSFDEYVKMFGLTEADLGGRILGCGDGPASFNATMRDRERFVVSVDPLYRFTADAIRRRVEEVCATIMKQLLVNQSDYVWTTIASPEQVGQIRMQAMEAFLADYPGGIDENRYLPHELPSLPFPDGLFDLAICSHLLFTYSEQLSGDFHRSAVLEMARVAGEVRVFPLLDMAGRPSPHLPAVCESLSAAGFHWAIQPVDYEFQRNGNQMLRLWC